MNKDLWGDFQIYISAPLTEMKKLKDNLKATFGNVIRSEGSFSARF